MGRARSLGILLGASVAIASVLGEAAAATLTLPEQRAAAADAAKKGLEALSAGRYEEAERLLDESLASVRLPGDGNREGAAKVLLTLAELAAKRNDAKLVEARLREAVAVEPDYADAQRVWSRFLFSQGRVTEALPPAERAVGLMPTAATRVELATLYSHLGRRDDAIREFETTLQLDPGHAGARYGLAIVLKQVGKFADAERQLKEAARLEPGNPLPMEALARLYAERGERPKALQAYDELLRLNPQSVAAQVSRGDVLLEMGKQQDAIAAYRAALALAPNESDIHLRMGIAEHARGNRADAQKAYLKATELSDKNAVAFNNLASLALEGTGTLDQALSWARTAVALAPNSAALLETLGMVQRARKNLPEAAASLEKAVALPSVTPLRLYRLGLVYDEQGKRDLAVTFYQKALDADPAFSEAKTAQARLKALRAK